jgi:uncharacterized protein with HEPN domain
MSEKRSLELFLVDTPIAIKKVQNYTKNFTDVDALLHDELHWDATIRQFEIMGEALNNLLKEEDFTKHSPQYFRKIVNFRNSIAHGYFGIVKEEVWDIIQTKLDTLDKDIQTIIKQNFDISLALEQETPKHQSLTDYLTKLKEKN